MRILSSVLLSVLFLNVTAYGQSAAGTGKGFQSGGIGLFGDALLQGFDFSFLVIGDRNIRNIKVDPDPMSNRVNVAFTDQNFDDPYRWKVNVRSYSHAMAQDGEESGSCRGVCTRQIYIPRGYTFVLSGFSLSFHRTDHHIDQIGIWERNGKLTVAFNDKNNDDLFNYRVNYVLIPSSLLKRVQTVTGSSAGSASTSILRGSPVMRGFSVNYASGDHKMTRFAVQLSNGSASVKYADKNSDDTFSWHIDYGIL